MKYIIDWDDICQFNGGFKCVQVEVEIVSHLLIENKVDLMRPLFRTIYDLQNFDGKLRVLVSKLNFE